MADLNVTGLDRTVQETDKWLKEIGGGLEVEDRQIAYHALRGVLYTLRDRIEPNETFHLAAQLPLMIRGIFFEGYKPANKPEKFRGTGRSSWNGSSTSWTPWATTTRRRPPGWCWGSSATGSPRGRPRRCAGCCRERSASCGRRLPAAERPCRPLPGSRRTFPAAGAPATTT